MFHRSDFMTAQQKALIGALPRTHKRCLDLFKVARPGKTAKDKHLKGRKS